MLLPHLPDSDKIAEAIEYICAHFHEHPSVAQIAQRVCFNPTDFEELFFGCTGVSLSQFLRYIALGHVKHTLIDRRITLGDGAIPPAVTWMRDLSVGIERMSLDIDEDRGQSPSIDFSFGLTLFGEMILASTKKGICYMAFVGDKERAIRDLKRKYPNAVLNSKQCSLHQKALRILCGESTAGDAIQLHISGTDFQIKVWEVLLKIPPSRVVTYGDIARYIGCANASRAVGAAVGNNPVAFFIPCHRVIQASGALSGYLWGTVRKAAIIGWEFTLEAGAPI